MGLNQKPRIAVIGGGPAGLFAARGAVAEGASVVLFERHSKPGGCASFFRRKISDLNEDKDSFAVFDAGATILSGVQGDGWLRRLLEKWGVVLPQVHLLERLECRVGRRNFVLDPSHLPGWINSLREAFPQDRDILEKAFSEWGPRVELLRSLMQNGPHLPWEKWQDICLSRALWTRGLPLAVPFVRGHFTSFGDELLSYGFSHEFLRWVDMQTLITLQCNSTQVHPLWGLLALFFYPAGVGSCEGGMKAFFQSLQENLSRHARVEMRTPILKIEEKENRLFCRTSEKWWGPFDQVISSIPRYNTRQLVDPTWYAMRSAVFGEEEKDLWGALVGYAVIRDQKAYPEGPWSAHLGAAELTETVSSDLYLSFSARGDVLRAPKELRTLTISTHVRLAEWKKFSTGGYRASPEYLSLRSFWSARLLSALRRERPDLDLLYWEVGTPATFWRYTRREGGSVGGFPLNQEKTGFHALSQRTFHPRLYQVGDTSFPGQSVEAAALGGILVLEKIWNRKILGSHQIYED